MKFLHIADLHFGKSIYGKSMLDSDQPYWVDRFLEVCDTEKPDAVVVAGDVYDRASPSGEAVDLLDRLITELSSRDIQTFMIAGNHDSAQKLSFGKKILAKGNIHISGKLEKELTHVTLMDEYGPVTFWLLPYLFPEQVSVVFEDDTIHGYDQAVRKVLSEQDINFNERNVILSHQNVTAFGKEIEHGGSESMVGGVGQVDFSVFDGFEYAALGHIHSAFPVGREEVRYAGTPLCYHFEELKQKDKGPVVVVLGKKGDPIGRTSVTIDPLHRLNVYKGTYDKVLKDIRDTSGKDEYVSIHVTDQRISPENHALFRELLELNGSLLMECLSEFNAFGTTDKAAKSEDVESLPVEALFAQLYRYQNNDVSPTETECKVLQHVGNVVRSYDNHMPLDPKYIEDVVNFVKKNTKDNYIEIKKK